MRFSGGGGRVLSLLLWSVCRIKNGRRISEEKKESGALNKKKKQM